MKPNKKIEFTINQNGCHICVSHSTTHDGYPVLKRAGKLWLISRWTYTQSYGTIPTRLQVRHTCDNRLCINIDHLILGTNQDNVNDRTERNRHNPAKGEKASGAKLTEQQVKQIRMSILSHRELAEMFGVHFVSIKNIRNRKTWKHI